MKKWMRRIAVVFVILLVIAAGAYYWLIDESHAPKDSNFAMDMGKIRQLANSLPGEKPNEIRVEEIAPYLIPTSAVVAGTGWTKIVLPGYSYELVYPDHTALIDTALDGKLAQITGTASFNNIAYERMRQVLNSTSLIVFTHEHPDHLGGFYAQPNLTDILKKTRLSREQVSHPEFMAQAALPAAALSNYQPLDYEQYFAIAPGMVLIKAPGHSPGSQMVFVQEENGSEFLFLGDVAWQMRNIDEIRERARLVTWRMLHENRDQVFAELTTLHSLKQSEPRVHLVPGHDGDAVSALITDHALVKGFQ